MHFSAELVGLQIFDDDLADEVGWTGGFRLAMLVAYQVWI